MRKTRGKFYPNSGLRPSSSKRALRTEVASELSEPDDIAICRNLIKGACQEICEVLPRLTQPGQRSQQLISELDCSEEAKRDLARLTGNIADLNRARAAAETLSNEVSRPPNVMSGLRKSGYFAFSPLAPGEEILYVTELLSYSLPGAFIKGKEVAIGENHCQVRIVSSRGRESVLLTEGRDVPRVGIAELLRPATPQPV